MLEASVFIKPKREKPIVNHHPWVFSGAIREIDGYTQPGDIVVVKRHDGMLLGRGYYNPHSQIQVRMLAWEDEPIDAAWWRDMLAQAVSFREGRAGWDDGESIGCRLVNAENDYLPGLVVDRYGAWLVLQALTLGIDKHKVMIAELLAELVPGVLGIYERSDVDVRRKEGLEEVTGVLWGEAPPEAITIKEGSEQMTVNVYNGHKTGYYLDQADSRALVGDLCMMHGARGPLRLLNLFSYTGGFGVQAMAGGDIHVVNVDASMDALQLAERNMNLNMDPAVRPNVTHEHIQADVFEYLRDQAEEGELYDIVVLDPPKFAHNKHQVDSASRGYKDINMNALKLVQPGGYLLTFSCSGAISADLFQKIVFGALVDSGRQAQVLEHLGPSDDHPVALTFPEGAYLKGLLLRVL